MTEEINYTNNPLHGVSLKNMLTELVDYYGFEILYAYLNINCFKTNPSIESSVKFLKKTDWAREKVEVFYLYEYKNLPRASSEQFKLSPRERVIPEGQKPGKPKELSLEDAEKLREKREKKAAAYGGGHRSAKRTESPYGGKGGGRRQSAKDDRQSSSKSDDNSPSPWANWKGKS